MKTKPTAQTVIEAREPDAKIGAESAAIVAHIATQLDRMLRAEDLQPTSPDTWRTLWCADVADTFGMFDEFGDRMGLDARQLHLIRGQVADLLPAPDLAEALSVRFADNLRGCLSHADLARVVIANKADPEAQSGLICHSHDYCDANQAMLDAEEWLGIEHDAASAENAELINSAWNIAKARGFGCGDFAAGYTAFLTAFPQTKTNYGTGGGCTAFCIDYAGGYILLTDDNLGAPTPADGLVSVGAYNNDGDSTRDAEGLLTWAEALAWVRAELSRQAGEALAPLVAEFAAWTTAHGFNAPEHGDAEEILLHGRTTKAERDWLQDFMTRWDRASHY